MPPILAGLLPNITGIVGKLIDRIPDPEARAKAADEANTAILAAMTSQAQAQSEINLEEAKNSNIFVSGWRPAIGWVCAGGFAWTYIFAPLLTWGLAVFGIEYGLPQVNADGLMQLTLGMLGLAGLRSFEKTKGVAR